MATDKPTLVLGTRNAKKRGELVELLEPHGVRVQTLAEFPGVTLDVDEDGDTFEHNARKKASEYAAALGGWVLADDSGVCVDALDGAPGVYSAHYAGVHGDNAANNALVLEKLEGVSPERRGAHYVAMLVLADPAGEVRAESRGVCHGRIAAAPRGDAGFGYDPLFEVREYHRTFGEMGPAVKRAISHRSRALRAILPRVVTLVSGG
ncbi:MAG: RdgB/HAM1 family non-canonical purine NTP pyrophosphatase [Planctomycetota bacterium]